MTKILVNFKKTENISVVRIRLHSLKEKKKKLSERK